MQYQQNSWVPLVAVLVPVVIFLVWMIYRATLGRRVRPTLPDLEPGVESQSSVPPRGPATSPAPFYGKTPAESTTGNGVAGLSVVPDGAPQVVSLPKCPGCDEEFDPGDGLFRRRGEFCETCEPIERSIDHEFENRMEFEQTSFQVAQNAKRQNWNRVGKLRKIRQVRLAEKERDQEEQKKLEAELTKLRAFRGES